jgi:hypothetical protein
MSSKYYTASSAATTGPNRSGGALSAQSNEEEQEDSVAEEIESEISEMPDEQDPYGEYEDDFAAISGSGIGEAAPVRVSAAAATATALKNPVVLNKAQPQATIKSKGQSFSSRGGDDDDGYSFSFEDNEVGESTPEKRSGFISESKTSSKTSLAQQIVPSIDMQALQAELSLQKLSEEVIQLRNKQRSLLKERWVQVRDKKSRAEARRQQHMMEVEELRNRIIKLTAECNDLKTANSSLSAALTSAEMSVKSHMESYNMLLKSLEAKNSEYEDLQLKLSNNRAELEVVRSQMVSQAQQHEVAISNTHKEIAKRDAQIEILSKSNEANEKR